MSLVSARRRAIPEEENSFFGVLNQIKSRKYALEKITISWREQLDRAISEEIIFLFFIKTRCGNMLWARPRFHL